MHKTWHALVHHTVTLSAIYSSPQTYNGDIILLHGIASSLHKLCTQPSANCIYVACIYILICFKNPNPALLNSVCDSPVYTEYKSSTGEQIVQKRKSASTRNWSIDHEDCSCSLHSLCVLHSWYRVDSLPKVMERTAM